MDQDDYQRKNEEAKRKALRKMKVKGELSKDPNWKREPLSKAWDRKKAIIFLSIGLIIVVVNLASIMLIFFFGSALGDMVIFDQIWFLFCFNTIMAIVSWAYYKWTWERFWHHRSEETDYDK
jgi:hypothetical protein